MSTEIHDEKKIGFIAIEIAMFHSWLKENHDVNLSWDDIKDVKELILKREDFQISKTMSLFMDTAIMQYLGEESEGKIKKLRTQQFDNQAEAFLESIGKKVEDFQSTNNDSENIDSEDVDINNEIPQNILRNFKTNSKVTEQEKEKIYEEAYNETESNSKNKKKGVWAKALVESEGDEKKTQTNYIKARVKSMIEEIESSRFEEFCEQYVAGNREKIIAIKMKEREKNVRESKRIIFKNILAQEKEERKEIEDNEKAQWHAELKRYHAIGDYKIAIFYYKITTLLPYYWVSGIDKNNSHIRRHQKTIEQVINDINDYFEKLVEETK